MKRISALVVLLAIFGMASCKKDVAYQSQYEKSFDAFQSFKKANNNSYYYVASFTSWGGYCSETKISVSSGVVISRDFNSFSYTHNADTAIKVPIAAWHETTDSLGVHKNSGAEPLTLDEIYAKAKSDWLKAEKKENKIYFEAENNGMLSSCGYVPNGCQDDCFIGINIHTIKAGDITESH